MFFSTNAIKRYVMHLNFMQFDFSLYRYMRKLCFNDKMLF